MVGAKVGENVGECDGDIEGWSLGDWVGNSDGNFDGTPDGWLLGDADGDIEGDLDGLLLGDTVGVNVIPVFLNIHHKALYTKIAHQYNNDLIPVDDIHTVNTSFFTTCSAIIGIINMNIRI